MNGCMLSFFEVGQPECATGDTASTTTVALIGDSNAAMWNPALQQVADAAALAAGELGKTGLPIDGPPIGNRLRRYYTECDQWRAEIIARLRAERPRLVVVSMSRLYDRPVGFRFSIRPGVDRQHDPPGAAAARHWREGAGARADPGSALDGADLPVRAPR